MRNDGDADVRRGLDVSPVYACIYICVCVSDVVGQERGSDSVCI